MDKHENKGLIRPGLFRAAAAVIISAMAVTGFGQMPMYKRYYVSDIPGFGWTADYYNTHNIHYAGAILLILLAAYMASSWAMYYKKTYRITAAGSVIIVSLAGIFFSGIIKVISSQKGVSFGTDFMLSMDIVHILSVFMFLVSAGIFKLLKKPWYEGKSNP